MLGTVLRKVFGSKNDRELKRLQPLVDHINQLEPSFTSLSLENLRAKTDDFRHRLAQGSPSPTSFQKPLLSSEKYQGVSSACATSMCN